ncbi:Sec-independent protein translocase protein TatA [Striga asiatica]|uniref:Sec-independent protein translocase protein TatA n=1 Tax=Striga asiatica TaxID=4170 RepID=A0A5A7PR36_STRAF|nr:Sec-independent protein translocase protein TatA [Striga asiatica]
MEFGDELIIESYKMPWLIWVQLLVMILLIALLFFGFTVVTSGSSTSSAAASPPTGRKDAPATQLGHRISSNGMDCQQHEHESSPEKDSTVLNIFQHPNHPCNYIAIAKKALFKCFGLGSGSESSTIYQHEKNE